MAATIAESVVAFREAAIAKGAGSGGPKDWRLYDCMAEAYHALIERGADGLAAFAELLADPHVEVRLWAASGLLHHGNPDARTVLEQIGSTRGMPGLDARMTLQEFDAGRLTRPFPRRGA